MTSYLDVAYLFLKWAYRDGEIVSNLKMQKLLYYAQAWHLVFFNNKPLFCEDIEAWALGPVIPEAYREFKSFGHGPLEYELADDLEAPFSKAQLNYLEECYTSFVSHSPHALVNMTHNEKPWKDAFAKGNSSVISHNSMKEYYSSLGKK